MLESVEPGLSGKTSGGPELSDQDGREAPDNSRTAGPGSAPGPARHTNSHSRQII